MPIVPLNQWVPTALRFLRRLVVACRSRPLNAEECLLLTVDSQVIEQVEGYVEPGAGLEELRITNVPAYDHTLLNQCLKAKR